MPLSHAGATPAKPIITVISGGEFLIVSNLDNRGLAVFISGNGDPVRGTFEYSMYPVAVCKSLNKRVLRFLTLCSLLQHTTTPIWSLSCQTRVSRSVISKPNRLNRLSLPLNRLPSAQMSHDAGSHGTHRVIWSLPLNSRMSCNLYLYH